MQNDIAVSIKDWHLKLKGKLLEHISMWPSSSDMPSVTYAVSGYGSSEKSLRFKPKLSSINFRQAILETLDTDEVFNKFMTFIKNDDSSPLIKAFVESLADKYARDHAIDLAEYEFLYKKERENE